MGHRKDRRSHPSQCLDSQIAPKPDLNSRRGDTLHADARSVTSMISTRLANLDITFVAERPLRFDMLSSRSIHVLKLSSSVEQLYEACPVIQGEQMPKAIIARTRKDKPSICEG